LNWIESSLWVLTETRMWKYEFIFWDITQCSQLKVNWRFGGICCFYIEDYKNKPSKNSCLLQCGRLNFYRLTSSWPPLWEPQVLRSMCDYRRGFELEIWFLDYLQVVTASNCNTTDNFHILQITTANAKCFQFAITCRFLVMDLNNGDSSASVLNCFE
jgi:hypothetical protein